MANNDIPNFTPPSPTFTPPSAPRHNGPCCHYHQNEPAVDKCARCGKYICQDCAETYTVNSDEYKGKHLCYDCCKELVADNVKTLKKQKAKIIAQYVFTFLGMIVGAILGASQVASTEGTPWYMILVWALIFGCLWTFVKNVFKILGNTIKNFAKGAWLGAIFWFFVDMIKAIVLAIWGTIQKLFYYTKYIIQTSGFIKSDTAALQQMADYMEYTQVRNRNVGVDLATLMNEDSELSNNSYAQAVAANGEAAAEASLRNAAVTFNEHGEIIRSFAG